MEEVRLFKKPHSPDFTRCVVCNLFLKQKLGKAPDTNSSLFLERSSPESVLHSRQCGRKKRTTRGGGPTSRFLFDHKKNLAAFFIIVILPQLKGKQKMEITCALIDTPPVAARSKKMFSLVLKLLS